MHLCVHKGKLPKLGNKPICPSTPIKRNEINSTMKPTKNCFYKGVGEDEKE
jgi:hypothetical protein